MFADRLFNALERNEPAPGQLLVAAPGLKDEYFVRSVILLLQCGEEVTFGVNLVMRSDVAVPNVMENDWAELVSKPKAFYIGGPVEQSAAVAVGVTKPGVDIDSHPRLRRLANRLAHVDLNGSVDEVAEDLIGMRLFVGYSEWAPGQLDEEIERGDWYVAPALPFDVIAPGSADLWADVMARQPMPLPIYSTYPAHPGEN
ncbi:YqgE/AlgH family protein [Corynebacterium sp. 35RC1]|nr:YqgE/AlgH family protein [Corynebacterium sp. 35RC1]